MNEQVGSSWIGLYAEWLRAWAALAGGVPGDAVTKQTLGRPGGLGAAGQVTAVLAQANFATATALMRSWARAMESWVKYGQAGARGLAPLASGKDGEDLAKLVDEAREHLRRLGESAVEEAGELNKQLQALAEQLRNIVEDEPSSAAPPRRLARTKL